jgi:hypothetical protein
MTWSIPEGKKKPRYWKVGQKGDGRLGCRKVESGEELWLLCRIQQHRNICKNNKFLQFMSSDLETWKLKTNQKNDSCWLEQLFCVDTQMEITGRRVGDLASNASGLHHRAMLPPLNRPLPSCWKHQTRVENLSSWSQAQRECRYESEDALTMVTYCLHASRAPLPRSLSKL